ncbi:MAG: hypothetical protein JWQ79_2330 [Mucilaginibacter sp.]|nr:hypothetical protein [Mucilaginibacter sp.]
MGINSMFFESNGLLFFFLRKVTTMIPNIDTFLKFALNEN